jgi:hypothetical protein
MRNICLGAGTIDSELLHAAAQSVRVEIEDLRGTVIALDDPGRLFKDVEDVTLFDLFESAVRVPSGLLIAQ